MLDQSRGPGTNIEHGMFGKVRESRSRDNPHCDVCRERKTACIVDSRSPGHYCEKEHVEYGSVRTETLASYQLASRQSRGPTGGSPKGFPPRSPEVRQSFCATSLEGSSRSRTADTNHIQPTDEVVAAQYGDGSSCAPLSHPVQRLVNTPVKDLIPRPWVHSIDSADYCRSTGKPALYGETDSTNSHSAQNGPLGYDVHDPQHHTLLSNIYVPQNKDNTIEVVLEDIEDLVSSYGPALLRVFFKHIHPVFPIIDRKQFLQQYAGDKTRLPRSLRGIMYAISYSYWENNILLGISSPLKKSELFKQACSYLVQDLKAPNLCTLQACLLLMHFMIIDDERFFQCAASRITLSRAITCARMLSLHRDPAHFDIALSEKKLRKRLWWALYVVDCWAPLSSEHSSYIASDSFDTTPLLIDDANCNELVDQSLFDYIYPENAGPDSESGTRFIETVNLSQHMRNILNFSSYLSPVRTVLSVRSPAD
ncbi:hypothetical protein KCU65_g6280, partial [Aureobasidium melanogenum]